MGILYLASPYSHPDDAVVQRRYKMACRAAAVLIQQGWTVFSPIAHSHPIAETGIVGRTSDVWITMDLEILAHCERLLVLTLQGWEDSVGVAQEIAEATRLGIPIEYRRMSEILFSGLGLDRLLQTNTECREACRGRLP